MPEPELLPVVLHEFDQIPGCHVRLEETGSSGYLLTLSTCLLMRSYLNDPTQHVGELRTCDRREIDDIHSAFSSVGGAGGESTGGGSPAVVNVPSTLPQWSSPGPV